MYSLLCQICQTHATTANWLSNIDIYDGVLSEFFHHYINIIIDIKIRNMPTFLHVLVAVFNARLKVKFDKCRSQICPKENVEHLSVYAV